MTWQEAEALRIKKRNAATGKAWYERNKERNAATRKARYDNNKEREAATGKAWRDNNKERDAARSKAWYENNKERRAATHKACYEADKSGNAARSRARKRKMAICSFEHERDAMNAFYAETHRLGLTVDHIVPLVHKEKLVCGLHVIANLQMLTQQENDSKGSTYACE